MMGQRFAEVANSLDACLRRIVSAPHESDLETVKCVFLLIGALFDVVDPGERMFDDLFDEEPDNVRPLFHRFFDHLLESRMLVESFLPAARIFIDDLDVSWNVAAYLNMVLRGNNYLFPALNNPRFQQDLAVIAELHVLAVINSPSFHCDTAHRFLEIVRDSFFSYYPGQNRAYFGTIVPYWPLMFQKLEQRISVLTYSVRRGLLLTNFRCFRRNWMEHPNHVKWQSRALLKFHYATQHEEELQLELNVLRGYIAKLLCLSDVRAGLRVRRELELSDPRLARRLNRERIREAMLGTTTSVVDSKALYLGRAETIINDLILPMRQRFFVVCMPPPGSLRNWELPI